MSSFRPRAHSTPARSPDHRQQIVIPPGLIDPNNTTVVEIPSSLHNTPTVVARRAGSGPAQLTHHHHHLTEMPSSPGEAAGGPVNVTTEHTTIKSATTVITEPDDSTRRRSRHTRRSTPRTPCRCKSRSRSPSIIEELQLSEERERCRLEHDLINFQNARRRLIMHITQMGQSSSQDDVCSPILGNNTHNRRTRSYIDQPPSILEEIETIEDIDTVTEDTRGTPPLGPLQPNLSQTSPMWIQNLYPNWNTSHVSRAAPVPVNEPTFSYAVNSSLSYPGSSSLRYPGSAGVSIGPLPPDLSHTPPSWVRRQYPDWEANCVPRRSLSPPYGSSLSYSRSQSLIYPVSAGGSIGPLPPDLSQTPPSWVRRQYPDWEANRVPRRSPSPPYGTSLSYSRNRSLSYPEGSIGLLPPDLSQTPPSWVRRQCPDWEANRVPRRSLSQIRYSSSVSSSYSEEEGINTQTYTVDSQLVLPPAPPRRSPRCNVTRNHPRRVISETRIIEQESVASPVRQSSRRNIKSKTFVVKTKSPAIPQRPIIRRSPSAVIRSDTYSIEAETRPRSNLFTKTIRSESSLLEYEDDGSITPPIEYAPDSPYYQTSRTSGRTRPESWRCSTQRGPIVPPHFSGISSIAANESTRSGPNGRTYDISNLNRRTYNISNSSPRISESFHRSKTVIIDPNVTRRSPSLKRRRQCPCPNNRTRPGSTSWRVSTQRDQTVLPDFSGISSIGANETYPSYNESDLNRSRLNRRTYNVSNLNRSGANERTYNLSALNRSGANGRTYNLSALNRSGANGRTYNLSNLNRSGANGRTYNISNRSRAGRSQTTINISGVRPLDNHSDPLEYSHELYQLVSETSIKN